MAHEIENRLIEEEDFDRPRRYSEDALIRTMRSADFLSRAMRSPEFLARVARGANSYLVRTMR